MQKASAADIRLIDFAERRIPPDEIKSAGYDGVVNYVSESRPGANFEAKPITREYADALRAAGLQIVSNYQYGKPGWSAPSDFTRGYDGGVADAQTALRLHGCSRGSEIRPRSSSASMTISTSTPGIALLSTGFEESTRYWAWTAPASMGIPRRVRGRSKTASSGTQPLQGTGGHGRRSRGRTVSASPWRCFIRRWSTARRTPGPLLGGINVDVDEVLATDYGQWDFDR